MNNPGLVKTFNAEDAIGQYLIAKFGASAGGALLADGSTAALLGVATDIDAASGKPVDIVLDGIAFVKLGGEVAAGDWITADASGKAIKATFSPGAVTYVVGRVMEAGVSGDVVGLQIMPGQLNYDDSIFASATVEISSAELLALNATPKTVVAAPGAGYAIIPIGAVAFLDYATTAYDGIAAGEDIALKYTDDSGATVATIETTGFLDQASDQLRYISPVATNITPVENAAIVAHMLTAEIATGDSPLLLKVQYKLIPTTLSV